ncbi:MAG: copper chaperone PCu(A)C [Cocleimonas sp.]|nr:copper chaperone PCu(A)C [Cocleimonas sp.]
MKFTLPLSFPFLLLFFSNTLWANNINIEAPYVRAIPSGQTISAAFMRLSNRSDVPIDLIAASSNIASTVELHHHINEDGMMKMRQVPKISIAAKSKTELQPGGYHLMLIDLKQVIKPDDIIELTLKFSNGSQQTINAKVKKVMAGMMKQKMSNPPKSRADDAKRSMIKHTHPMPNLMRVINKFSDQLSLSEKQAAALKQWQTEHQPMAKKIMNTILKLEADLHTAAISDEPLRKIDQLADAIMQNRMKLIRGKALCRENMKKILNNEQYKQVVTLYTTKIKD